MKATKFKHWRELSLNHLLFIACTTNIGMFTMLLEIMSVLLTQHEDMVTKHEDKTWRHGDDLQTRGRHHVSKLCFAIRIAWQLCAHDNFAWVLCEMHLYVHSFIYVYFKQAYKKGRFTAHWWCMPRATGHASYDIRQANYVTDMLYDKCLNKKLLFAWACRITFPEDLTLYASNSLSSCTLSSTTGFEAVATGCRSCANAIITRAYEKQSTDNGLSQNDLGQHTDGRIFGRQPLNDHGPSFVLFFLFMFL